LKPSAIFSKKRNHQQSICRDLDCLLAIVGVMLEPLSGTLSADAESTATARLKTKHSEDKASSWHLGKQTQAAVCVWALGFSSYDLLTMGCWLANIFSLLGVAMAPCHPSSGPQEGSSAFRTEKTSKFFCVLARLYGTTNINMFLGSLYK
jgi:hypothetical protein